MSYLLFEVEVSLTKENFLRRNKEKDALGGSDFPIIWLYKDSHFFVVIHILKNECFLTLAISLKTKIQKRRLAKSKADVELKVVNCELLQLDCWTKSSDRFSFTYMAVL